MPDKEMPRWRCYKVVHAFKIASVTPILNTQGGVPRPATLGATIQPQEPGYDAFEVGQAYLEKHQPLAGGYYVVYEDGYASFSPGNVFEEGYTRIDDQARLAPEQIEPQDDPPVPSADERLIDEVGAPTPMGGPAEAPID